MTETKTCCVCHHAFEEWGNNAQPLMTGVCCDECNTYFVLPARLLRCGMSHDDAHMTSLHIARAREDYHKARETTEGEG